jgi:hypothetical protein
VQEDVAARLVQNALHEPGPLLRILQRIDGLEPFEGVLAIEDTGSVGALALHEQRATPESPVDGSPADQHRYLEPALVQLLHA